MPSQVRILDLALHMTERVEQEQRFILDSSSIESDVLRHVLQIQTAEEVEKAALVTLPEERVPIPAANLKDKLQEVARNHNLTEGERTNTTLILKSLYDCGLLFDLEEGVIDPQVAEIIAVAKNMLKAIKEIVKIKSISYSPPLFPRLGPRTFSTLQEALRLCLQSAPDSV